MSHTRFLHLFLMGQENCVSCAFRTYNLQSSSDLVQASGQGALTTAPYQPTLYFYNVTERYEKSFYKILYLSENYASGVPNLLQTLLIRSFIRSGTSRSFLHKIYFRTLIYLSTITKIVLKDLLIFCFLLEGRSVTKSIIIYYQGLFGALIDCSFP